MPNSQTVTFISDGTEAQGYLSQPTGSGAFPGVIVIQEWWGVDEHIKSVADRFAEAGFVALAVDLYHGQTTSEPDAARKLVMALDFPRVLREMIAAVNYLCGRAEVDGVGVIGFCLGGTLSLLLASKTPRVGAVASFYGGRQLDDTELMDIACPILAIYAGQDHGIPSEHIAHQREVWTRSGVPHEIVVYEQADHAFFNETRPEVYDAEAADDAWRRTLALFRKQLQSA
jgi:carboxymethylenebutenolidase